MTRWFYALVPLLLLGRIPSLVQPAGADQGLYSYVGTRILDGALPYRDAWDQKPPAIHFVYAILHAIWPHESAVAAADMLAATMVALMLLPLGRALASQPAAGIVAASLFLLLGDPTFNRLAGVRVRSQCETFIAVAITGALLLATTSRARSEAGGTGWRLSSRIAESRWWIAPLVIGALVGIAFIFKYNAVVYLVVALAAVILHVQSRRDGWRHASLLLAGATLPALVLLIGFAWAGGLNDLYQATIRYNVEYSGETYPHALFFFGYLISFPIQHARVDALWMVGGLGCLILLVTWTMNRSRWALLLPVAWVAAACVSIAINGSRGLPQYFVQAAPALATAAGVAACTVWPATWLQPRARPVARAIVILLVAFGAWRVSDFDKIPRNAAHDLAYLTGRISREAHLARYGAQGQDKYSALAVYQLGTYLQERTGPADYVYIFGFSPGAYVRAKRMSASRFFWSRPVLVGFNASAPGYGAEGVLRELEARAPKYVVLQISDWAPPPNDSAAFFLGHPSLAPWLHSHYERVTGFGDYDIWQRQEAGARRHSINR